MSTNDIELWHFLRIGNVREITNQLFPQGPQQPMPGNPALVEGPSPAADTGTAGVGDSQLRRKHERFVAQVFGMLKAERFDDALDLVRDEYRSIHGSES